MRISSCLFAATLLCGSAQATILLPEEVNMIGINGKAVSGDLVLLENEETYLFCSSYENESVSQVLQTDLSKDVRLNSKTDLVFSVDEGMIKSETKNCVRYFPDPDAKYVTLKASRTEWVFAGEIAEAGDEEDEFRTAHPKTVYQNINLLLPHTYDRNGDGVLAGSIIGIYPDELSGSAPAPVQRNTQSYAPPTDFYEITYETESLPISEYATLGEFVPEVLETQGKRLAPIDFDLLRLWDGVCESLKNEGRSPDNLKILRGFVSPQERLRLERLGVDLAQFTRFQYGDAMAIIYDADNNFRQDDMNGDGVIDTADLAILHDTVKLVKSELSLYGGIGVSSSFAGPNHIGTPYLHIDLRGWNLSWEE